MIDKTSESTLLKLIKFGPVTVMLCFAILMGMLVINENKTALQRNIKALSNNYIAQQRLALKSKIDALSAQVSYEKNTATERLQHDIKERVLEAYNIAMGIYRSNPTLSKKAIGQRIKDALRDVRFHKGRGYYFVTTLDGVSELLPIQPELEGTSLINMKDVKGTMIVQDMITLMNKREETFYHWWFKKPGNGEIPFFKIGFVKRFTPLQWYIGTGEYLVDF